MLVDGLSTVHLNTLMEGCIRYSMICLRGGETWGYQVESDICLWFGKEP